MVGTGGFEPPTPSVSGKCSPAELRAWNRLSLENRSKQQEAVTDIPKSGNRTHSLGHPGSLAEAHEPDSARRLIRNAVPNLVNLILTLSAPPYERPPAKNRKPAADQLKTREVRGSGLAPKIEVAAGRMVEASRGKRSTSTEPYWPFYSPQLRVKDTTGTQRGRRTKSQAELAQTPSASAAGRR